MYQVMLAEDEAEVLGGMMRTIRWEEHGFCKPVGCSDGAQAICELEQGFVPNVLITDVCMPFVDGLELTDYVTKRMPDTIVVILTGYNEFQYAQKAIRFQVFDYVLKPVTPANLYELLDRLKVELDERLRGRDESSMRIMGSYFLNNLVKKKLDNAVIEESCRYYQLNFEGGWHVCAALDIDRPGCKEGAENMNVELMRYGLCNIAGELAQERGAVAFQGGGGLCNIIISAGDAASCYPRAGALVSRIAQTTRHALKVTVSAGIGEPVASLGELYISHGRAELALDRRFYYGESSILFAADLYTKKTAEIDYLSCERNLHRAVRNLDREAAGGAVRELTKQLTDVQAPLEKCLFYAQKLLMKMVALADDIAGGQEAQAVTRAFESADLYASSTMGQLVTQMDSLLDSAFATLEGLRGSFSDAQVAKAELFIKDNYHNPKLSLNAVTEHISVSTSYFSAVFKAKTGMTFVEYLTQLRMEKAKQILTFTDQKTYETACSVGIADPQYFSVIFKRATGLTPREYREKHKYSGTESAVCTAAEKTAHR